MNLTWVIVPRCRAKEKARNVEEEGGKEKEEGKKEKTHRFMIHPLKSPQRSCYIQNHQPSYFIRMIKT